MAKKVVGLKLGASRLNAACVAVNGSAEVVQLAGGPLPPGVIAGGELREVEALADALKEFFGKNKLPKRNVRIGLANNRIGVRTIEVSGIDDPKQLANAVRFRAQEALPIPIDEAVLDFQILSEGTAADGSPSKRVLLVVAYRDLIAAYVEACRLAGIRLLGVDLEAFALLRALTPAFATEPGGGSERSALVAISIGSERSVLGVSDGFSCEYTRVLDWGGNALTDALARGLELEANEAERIKVELGLQGDRVPRGRRPRAGRPRARGAEGGPAGLRPRARFLAPVLPGPARVSRDPRARPRRRHGAACRTGLRARAARRRPGPRRRPAGRRLRRQAPQGRRAEPGLRSAHRPRDGELAMDLKKEVKLSDLFRRGKGPVDEDVAIEEKPAKEKKPRTSFSFSRAKKEPKAPEEQNVSPKSAPPPPAVPLMRAFDLMPNESEREKTAASPAFLKIVVALVALLVLAALAGAFMLMSARANDRQAEADDLRAQLAELTAQATPDVDQGAGAIAGEGQARTAALSEALSARVAWDRILREFSLVLPEDVWLTSIASTTGTATTTPGAVPSAAGEGTFTINGQAHTQADVAVLLSRLEVVPEFSSVTLQSSSRGADSTTEGGASGSPSDFSFSIVATIVPEGVPAE